jgi:hypothetical protein
MSVEIRMPSFWSGPFQHTPLLALKWSISLMESASIAAAENGSRSVRVLAWRVH